MVTDSDQAWYLIYTKPHQERVAKENLERQSYDAYLPLFRKTIRRGRQFTTRVEPLFPRYLFIHLSDQSDNWAPIRSTIGVTHLVKFGNKPASIPDTLIKMLREHEDESGIHDLPERDLRPGERVQFVDGALSGYEAIFQTKTSSERVIVLMDIAGKHSRLIVAKSDIESADE